MREAAGIAVKLVEKHNGDLSAIEKEMLEMEIPAELVGIEGFNYRDEILWNVKYLRSFMPRTLGGREKSYIRALLKNPRREFSCAGNLVLITKITKKADDFVSLLFFMRIMIWANFI